MDDKMKLFLHELSQLSMKHGIFISGCGCCGSPSCDANEITEQTKKGFYTFDVEYASQLLWVDPSDQYHWEKYGNG